MFFDESLKDVYLRLNSSKDGLSTDEAKRRLRDYGYNELEHKKKHTVLTVLLNQFKSFLILLLLVAAGLSLFLGEHLEFYGILAIILFTIISGFIQEYSAERAMDALKKITAPFATVIRDGRESKIPARELVPGDVVLIVEGDIVPADLRIISSDGLEIDEASLTGESVPSKKSLEPVSSGQSVPDQLSMAFSGTIVTKGDGRGIVTVTGKDTEFGKIADTIQQIEETETPLQIKFNTMAKQLTIMVLALVAVVFLISIFTTDKSNIEWGTFVAELFIFSLSLAVAAVPSALAAIVTISLSRGAKRLASKNMIIKRLPAAESLGAVTVICSDKTGTLTKNQMTITKVFMGNHVIDVTGTGYIPSGEFYHDSKKLDSRDMKDMDLLLKIGYLCNDSKLVYTPQDSDSNNHVNNAKYAAESVDIDPIQTITQAQLAANSATSSAAGSAAKSFSSAALNATSTPNASGTWSIIGDPTEGSLHVLAKKSFIDEKYIEENYEKVCELPFDSDRKLMSSIYENYSNKKTEAYIKGAPDFVLKLCTKIFINGKARPLTKSDRDAILQQNNCFAEDALRVLALAYKDVSKLKNYETSNVETDLVFVGLVGMIDPPRDGVREAIAQCDSAGIRVMMITGDHPTTAKAIARQLYLLRDGDLVLTGSELDKLSDDDLEKQIDNIRIIARALPIQKTRIVDALQRKGHIVAMTGDGVNDAPALKKADVGIAMGITGTDVSKEVAKTILVDDNFATIVNAVAEGRNIYDRILKSTKYLLACNMGEVTTVFLAVLLGLPLPLITLQILLMNLLTDGLPALGLGSEKAEDDVMKHRPRNPKQNPLTKDMLMLIFIFGLAMGLGTLFTFGLYYKSDLKTAQTVAFTTLVMFEMFAVMSARSFASFRRMNPFSNKWLVLGISASVTIQLFVLYNPFLQKVFGTVALGLKEWLIILGISCFGFILMELSKLFVKEKYEFNTPPELTLPKI